MDQITLLDDAAALTDEETAPLLEAAHPEIAAAIRQLAATLDAHSDEIARMVALAA
jgi:hypothetical protein